MGFKDGFDASVTRGLQRFIHCDEMMVVVYSGAVLNNIFHGQVVFFQRTDGLYWCGRTYPDYYAFELELPINTVIEGMAYIERVRYVRELHGDNFFDDQFELPF